jgi:hypothetical protein
VAATWPLIAGDHHLGGSPITAVLPDPGMKEFEPRFLTGLAMLMPRTAPFRSSTGMVVTFTQAVQNEFVTFN